MSIFVSSILCLTFLGISAGWILGCLSQKFAPQVDPLIEKVREVLPGANCGACGFSSCAAFAQAVVEKKTEVNKCRAGRKKVWETIDKILKGENNG